MIGADLYLRHLRMLFQKCSNASGTFIFLTFCPVLPSVQRHRPKTGGIYPHSIFQCHMSQGVNTGFIYCHPAAFPKRRNTKLYCFSLPSCSIRKLFPRLHRFPAGTHTLHVPVHPCQQKQRYGRGALIQDSELHTVIQYLIPDSPLVQISPHPVKLSLGMGRAKGLLFWRWFCSGNIHRRLLTQDLYGFRISHAIYLHQKPEGRHSTDILDFQCHLLVISLILKLSWS